MTAVSVARAGSWSDEEESALFDQEADASHTAPIDKGSQIRARIAANRDKRLRIAESMKREAGVTGHEISAENFGGLAFIGTGRIKSPGGENMRQLYTVAHECGHIFLHNEAPGIRLPSHVMEMEAESYAHQAFREHGMNLPRRLSNWGRTYVASWIEKDRAAGKPIDPRAVAYANGTRSPYEPLRMVPPTWRHHVAEKSALPWIGGLRRALSRWRNPAQGTLLWTLFDIGAYVGRGFTTGAFVAFLAAQFPSASDALFGGEPGLGTLAFFIITGGAVGACLVLLRRPILPPRRANNA